MVDAEVKREKPVSKELTQGAIEINLLIEAIFQKFGYDFHNYSHASFHRRLLKACSKFQCNSISDLLHRTLNEPDFFPLLLDNLTVTVTEIFRDPSVYRVLREEVLPHLRAYPEIKIWCAGCAGGDEVFSIAIMLLEEGLYDRAIIYGTDINPSILKRARQGILSLDSIQKGTQNYIAAGGKQTLSDYYTAKYDAALLNQKLQQKIVFSDHNLVTDGAFGEMQLILCRNVLIYFNRQLQDHALTLFLESLSTRGFLCFGHQRRHQFLRVSNSS